MKGKNIIAYSLAAMFSLFIFGTSASGAEQNKNVLSNKFIPVQQSYNDDAGIQYKYEDVVWSKYKKPAKSEGKRESYISDTTGSAVRYQDDFYGSVNNEWLKEADKYLSDDLPEISNYVYLQLKSSDDVKKIFKDILHNSSKYSSDSTERKMANLYCNILDENQRDKLGSKPAKEYTDKIKNVKNIDELTELLSTEEMDVFNNLFRFKVMPYTNPKINEVYIQPTLLGLVNSDDYFSDDKESEKNREEYIKYIASLLILDGYSEKETVDKVLQLFEFESRIATSMMGLESIKDGNVDYGELNTTVKINELDEIAPNLQLSKFMKGLGIDKSDGNIVIQQRKWLENLNGLYTEENLPLIKNYVEITMLQALGQFMSSDFKKVTEDYIEYLQGSSTDISKEDAAYSIVYDNFKDEFGKLYAEEYCSEEERRDIELLAKELISKYREKILKCNWISETTKKNAIKKLDSMKIYIGYPDTYEDYSGIDIKLFSEGGSLVENMMNISVYQKHKEFQSLYEPVNNKIFSNNLTPSSVVAEYHFDKNSLVVTAGMLEPNIYDINDSKEKKLATVGFVIGHEISHAFDDLGALYDSNGDYNNWWTTGDYAKFNERARNFEDYFNNIECYDNEYINGQLTLGENIADITSLACIMDILNDMPDADYKEFFECFADSLKCARREEDAKLALLYDQHPPYKWRVNSALSQVDKFYEIYDIKEGDKMYVKPEDRLTIWDN